jgi:hypothetical protein
LPLGILILVFDVVLIVHAAKTGRFWPWAYVILFLPGVGGLAYIVAELGPQWFGSYRGQRARRQISATLDPTRRYRELREALGLVDTLANRAALAKECLDLRRFAEARSLYEDLLARPLGDEPHYALGKAQAEYGLGRADDAVATLEDFEHRWPDAQTPDGLLLYALALERVGRTDEAVRRYEESSRHFPGVEPQVRCAELLYHLGRQTEARALAEDVVAALERAPSYTRRQDKEWLASARRIARP